MRKKSLHQLLIHPSNFLELRKVILFRVKVCTFELRVSLLPDVFINPSKEELGA
jgi:hypothetical protein